MEHGNLSISEAAKRMGKTAQFVRKGLQDGVLPFGCAVKMNGEWSYHIAPKAFAHYMGDENYEEKD